MDSLRALIQKRVTCRKFTDETLSREQITGLIQDAVWVPSGSNNQPWRFVVVTDKARMKAYSDAAKQDWLDKLASCPYIQQYEEQLKNPNYNIFYDAPALIIIYGDSQAFWHVYDCSMVAYNLHLLAEEDGLGCCWIGFAHNLFSDPAVKKELGVPEGWELVAPIILGHPDGAGKKPTRRKPFDITFA
ncbi:MAG: nitroreductase [Syntrophotaleaceae bacterium]